MEPSDGSEGRIADAAQTQLAETGALRKGVTVDSNHELALLLVLAAVGVAAAVVLVVSLVALTIGLVASFLGALMTGAARSLTVPRAYARSVPSRESSEAIQGRMSGPVSQRERDWLDSWFEEPVAPPSKWSLARRPARAPGGTPPSRTPARLRRMRLAAAGTVRVAVGAGHRALTGPREWLQPGTARPVNAAARARSSWLFNFVGRTLPSRAPIRRGQRRPLWRPVALFGYPGRRRSKTLHPDDAGAAADLPRIPRTSEDHGDRAARAV